MGVSALVTGATDGIGLELSRQLAAQDFELCLVGRRPLPELDDPLFDERTYCRSDLADPGAAARVSSALEVRGLDRLDLVIHNAGVGWYGDAAQETPDRVRTTLDVNLWAPVALTHALLPRLLAARGTLVFVSSLMADLPAPDIASYAASKAALDGLARSLRVELRGRIRVVSVHPGGVATAMHEKAGVPAASRARFRFPSAEHVASRILRHAQRGARNPTIGTANRLARLLGRHAAGPLDWAMRRRRR